MIENLVLSLNVVIPLFLQMLLGNGLKKLRLLTEHTIKELNHIAFRIFLPILLFYNIYTTDLEQEFNGKLVMYAVFSILILFLLLMIFVPIFEKKNSRRGVLVQVGFRSNFVLFGLPVAISLFGADKVGSASLLIAVIVPLFNMLAVVALESFRGKDLSLVGILKGIVTNPLILASILAIILNLNHIRLFSFLTETIGALAKIATPLSLIVLGAQFRLEDAKHCKKQLIAGLILRLLVVPAIFLPPAVFLGFRGSEFIPLMIMYCAPAAVSSYTMAELMDGDGILASQLVFYSTACSVITLFLIIFLVKTIGII